MPKRLFAVLAVSLMLIVSWGCRRDVSARRQQYVESGNRYYEQGKYDEAAIQFLNAIKLDPKFAEGHFRLAEAYIRLEAWPEAYRELQRTVTLDPDHLRAQLELGNLLLAARSLEEAQGVADKLLKQYPTNADAHILHANLEIARDDREAAIGEIQNAIGLDSNRPEFYVQLAMLQSATHLDVAQSALQKALAVHPKFVPAIEALAIIYRNIGRNAEAENLLKQAIQLDAKNLKPRGQLAQLYLSEDRKSEAERVMVQAKNELGREKQMYRVLGEYYVNTGELEKATSEFALLSRQHPTDLSVTHDYVELLLRQNKTDEAERVNDDALKKNPKDAGAQMLRGRILNLRGQFNDAIDILQAALKDAPQHAGGHYQLGFAFNKTGNLERAEQEWRNAIKLEPRLIDAQLAIAQIALRKDDRTSLRQAAEQIIRSAPFDPRGYILRAEAESRSNQSAAADADFGKAIQVAPQSSLGYSAMGGWLFKLGKLPEAQKYYEQALSRDPNEGTALNGLVAIFVQRKQNTKAQERVQQQIAKAPNNDAFYVLLGGLQAVNKDMAGAEASLQRAINLNKNNLGAFLLLSNLERDQGSTGKALATAYKSIEHNPKNVAGYFLAGSLEESRGNWSKAEALYQQAMQVEPNFPPAANNLAYGMLEHQEDVDLALSYAQIARQKMPESPSTADTLAWVYYQKHIYRMAADLLEEVVQKVPDNATYHYHLGMVYQKQNNTAAAREHLQRALQINPNLLNANEIRKVLNPTS